MGFNRPGELVQYRKNTQSLNVVMGEAERRERQRGGDAAEHRMTDVYQLVCVCVFLRGVTLIKVAHLQIIKELLSFIKANLLKHAVQGAATRRL